MIEIKVVTDAFWEGVPVLLMHVKARDETPEIPQQRGSGSLRKSFACRILVAAVGHVALIPLAIIRSQPRSRGAFISYSRVVRVELGTRCSPRPRGRSSSNSDAI